MTLGLFQKKMKYVFLIVISLVVFMGTIFFGKNAADYFASASQCPAQNVRSEKVSPNSSTIIWETNKNSQGRVEYGTNAQALTFTAPEGSATSKHSVPLTLLTPNTIYYYLVAIGDSKCDSTSQKCDGNCVPFSFTTSPLTGLTTDSESPAPSQTRATQAQTTPANPGQPTSALSLFCRAVQTNIGKNDKVTAEWVSLKSYDIDTNGIINGLDVIKCQKSGK